jgi:hypothetical protein
LTGTEARLARIRGRALPCSHNAGADKQRITAYAGFPAPFGQSRFALARGNAFEAQVKADGGAELFFPPLLGTGGNDGRLDFSTNFHQRLLDVMGTSDNNRARSVAIARDLLADAESEQLQLFNSGCP